MNQDSSPEMELLCACIHPSCLAGSAGELLRKQNIDWPLFLALATNHHVIPLAYKALKSAAKNAGCVPAEWLAQMQSRYVTIAAFNLRATATLHRVQRLLESNGIQAIPIKGPALAFLAYGDIALRQYEDLDLIVRQADLLRAVELLEQDGYVTRELSLGIRRRRYLASLQDWSLHKGGSAPLDLKPVIISHALSRPRDIEFMAKACRPIAIGEGRSLRAPGPEAMLLAVCLDGANEMWFKLSSVADASALLTNFAGGDWAGLLRDTARFGQKRSLLVGAHVAEALLGCSLPRAFQEEGRKDTMARRLALQAVARLHSLAPRHTMIARQSWFAFQTRERLRDRWRFLSRLLFVPGAFELNSMPLPDALYPIYSLVRPFRLAWDVLGRGGRHRQLTVCPVDEPPLCKARDS